ncbi:MAG TPA: glycosyltransferase [Terriglobales bacterium]|nr:glycosyltransferase [Terriglobales bacterium]
MTAIRVLVLTSLFPPRPGEKQGNFVLDQVRALASQGADVTVLVAQPWLPSFLRPVVNESKFPLDVHQYEGEPFRVANTSFFSLPRYALGTQAAKFIAHLVPAIREIHADKRIDVIHAHGLPLGHAAVTASAQLEIPSVLSVHGIETSPRFDNSQPKRDQIGRMLEQMDRVILVGSPLLEYVRRYTTKTDHCLVVGNGFTSYNDLVASTRIPRKRPVRVIAVSRYEPSKGFEVLVEGVALLEPEIRNQLEVVLVGGGDEFREVLSKTNDLGIPGQVRHLGVLSHREAMSEVLASDIFCLPSWREAFGIMYAEAMSLGKFTIGCDGQGPSDFIRHLETGYLLAPRSIKAVAEALRWAALHTDERSRIAEAGRTFARGHLTWKENASRIVDIYRELLSSKTRAEEPVIRTQS